MRGLLELLKKKEKMNNLGVSEMVGYTLLVVIAVGLSVLVYAYLRVLIPKQQPQCPDGINLAVQSISCSSGQLSLSLTNKGRYTITAAYIRLGPEGEKIKTWINKEKGDSVNSVEKDEFNFAQLMDPNTGNQFLPGKQGLEPGSSFPSPYPYEFANDGPGGAVPCSGQCEVEIQPAVADEETGKLAACASFITQKVTCS